MVLVFLNNDTRVDANWLKELVRPLSSSKRVVCSCSNILNWDASRTELAGRDVDAFGLEHESAQITPTSLGRTDRPFLFASGGSMAIFKTIYLRVSGFDYTFGMYHEDVDLGWRLWLLGYEVRYCKASIVYHRSGSTGKTLDYNHQEALRIFQIRNMLYTVIKNLDEDHLTQLLPAILSYIRYEALGSMQFQTVAEATVQVMLNLREVLAKRKRIQSKRIRSDSEIFARTGHPFQFLLNSDYMPKPSPQIREEDDGASLERIRQILIDSLIAQVSLTPRLINEHNELAAIRGSLGYRFMRFYASKIDRLFPIGTKRGEFRQRLTSRVAGQTKGMSEHK
jgi:hypothetical protein